eukprot:scaffold195_cov359-Prasinococcus_capsulatus_cf.AAC.11
MTLPHTCTVRAYGGPLRRPLRKALWTGRICGSLERGAPVGGTALSPYTKWTPCRAQYLSHDCRCLQQLDHGRSGDGML